MGTGFGQNVRAIPTHPDRLWRKRRRQARAPKHAGWVERPPWHRCGGRRGKGQSSRQNVRAIPTFREAASTDCRKRPLAAPTPSRKATTGRHIARNRSGKMITGPEMIIGAPSKLKTGSAKMITGGAKLQVEFST